MRQAKLSYPVVSIAIATYNSERTLEKTLKSIEKQTYPKNKIEVLIIDGGSTDRTIAIAKKYKSKIIPNPKVELDYAKHIGYLQAKGKYLLYLDSDELLENNRSIEIKYLAFKNNKNVRGVMPSGFKSPRGISSINDYITEFGDPFSFFVYRETKGYKFLIKDFSRRFTVVDEDINCVVLDFKQAKYLPLIEPWAGGSMVDLQYLKSNFPILQKDLTLIAHIYYLLIKNKNYLAISKQDNTIHYSCESIRKYLKKIGSRVRNNVYLTNMGKSGYEGREQFQPNSFRIKKYFFVPYSIILVLPLYDGITLAVSRKKAVYLLHPFLCLYTTVFILYYYILKFIGITPKIKTYGK